MSINAVGASSNRLPNRKILKVIHALGVIMLVVGLGLSGYAFVHDQVIAYGSCVADTSGFQVYGVRCSGIQWYHYALPIIIGFVAAGAAHVLYRHYYVRVYDGVVVGLDITSGRYNTFYVCLEGLTLAGEERTYWVDIRYNTWRKLKDGDHFSW